jgi:[acyl-carrier-protein] S-malonyltransferase
MGKIAFLFPGQGAQYVGMAKDVIENSESSKTIAKSAEEAINFDLTKIMFDGPVDELKANKYYSACNIFHSVLLSKLI